jgi:mono/diheme cytochrome c family protein
MLKNNLRMGYGSKVLWLTVCLVVFQVFAVEETEAQDSPRLAIQGEYLKGGRGIQVAALAGENYLVSVFQGGLPGSGWDRGPVQTEEMDREELAAVLEGAERTQRVSPTLGARPPAAAEVLFDGTQESVDKNWMQGAKRIEGDLLLAGCTTKSTFRDYRLHLEFRTPFVPEAMGQGRGNSGVYHQGRYETQVLDSFGFENEGNTCGAIYGVSAAEFNACFPPMTWQTYDVEFVAPRWDDTGKKISEAKLTVWLNGYPIHRERSVPGSTTAAPVGESPSDGPLYLQDHGNPVAYRNIWIVPMDAERVAQRPRVAGYERLAAASSSPADQQLSGRILISELGCLSCHSAGKFEGGLARKDAPVLEQVGNRIRPGYIASMLLDVHGSKVGTTMPDLLHGLPESEREATAKAIGAYLQSTGKTRRHARVDVQAAQRGKQLYERVGCAVCHGMADGSRHSSTTLPFPDLSKKYSLDGLALFLKQPHTVRPSNRMPGMHLDDNESRDLAHYLLPSVDPSDVRPNMKYQVYEGGWNKLPDFQELKPVATGDSEGLDLSVSGRANNYAVRFESYVTMDVAGKVRFHLGSDDGSRLLVDGKKVVDVDGIHPHQTASGDVELTAGPHKIVVEYFQGGGEATLELQWESAMFVRQPIDGWLQLEPGKPVQGDPRGSGVNEAGRDDAGLIARGKGLFQSVGCVQCHGMKETDLAESRVSKAPSIDKLKLDAGCLATEVPKGLPEYRLTSFQKDAIVAALSGNELDVKLTGEQHSRYTLAKLNCVACHQRNGFGGPEGDKLELFTSTIPEMGDEGRLPPRLTGVGDKLAAGYLDRVLSEGARHRPYMQVRMPQYRNAAQGLAEHWKQADRPQADRVAKTADEAEIRTIAAGRLLAGNKGLSCAQCHTFGNERAIGIQAINLLTMTERLRPEWFYRYMLEPTKYRPGTRMPASFPEGVSVLKSVYEGNAEHQIAALWKYMSQGGQAATPEGLQRNQIALEPTDRPILYRNFLEGLSARGIAVGYPGGLNIAWDAETMNMAKLWQGQFIDASMHWRDRGVGRQKPLGDLVLNYESVSPVARLSDASDSWPDAKVISEGAKFLGYRLDAGGVPTFRYRTQGVVVSDRAELSPGPNETPGMKRSLTLTHSKQSAGDGVWMVRLASGNAIHSIAKNTWSVEDRYQITIDENLVANAAVREVQGRRELVISLPSADASIEYYLRW